MASNRSIGGSCALAVCVIILTAVPGTAQTQIVPTPPAVGGNYVIAVISDGYTSTEEPKFNRAVAGLVVNGLMADPFYAANKAAFTIYRIFKASAQSQQSLFGITPNYDVNRCYINYDAQQTTLAIWDAVNGVNVTARRTIVVGNYEGVSLGCTVDDWSYVSAGAREVGGILEHEVGHLVGGLFDEFVLQTADYPGPNVDGPNCSNVYDGSGAKTPIWASTTWPQSPVNVDGCRFYATKIYRPYDNCRMRSPDTGFCYVCAQDMSDVLGLFTVGQSSQRIVPTPILAAGFVQPPAPAPRSPRRAVSVRLLVEITKPAVPATSDAKARIVALKQIEAAIVHVHKRIGDYVYGIVENGKVVETEVLAGDPYQQRAYGGAPAPHRADDDPITKKPAVSAKVVVVIPSVTRQQLAQGAFEVVFFRLDPREGAVANGKRPDVTNAMVQDFLANRTVLAKLTANDIQKAVMNLP